MPSFRAAFRQRRCFVFADGYYEWTGPKGKKQPYQNRLADDRPLLFFDFWESWRGSQDASLDDLLETCTILTTEATADLAHIHDRMPCVSTVAEHNALPRYVKKIPDMNLDMACSSSATVKFCRVKIYASAHCVKECPGNLHYSDGQSVGMNRVDFSKSTWKSGTPLYVS